MKKYCKCFTAWILILSMLLALAPANVLAMAQYNEEAGISDASELNYILGRPMTEEELEEQKALQPDSFPEIPDETVCTPLTEEEESQLRARVSIPSSYDSRDTELVTPVKNQHPWGLCWVFTITACAEISLIAKGLAAASIVDLSERHLAYFCYHPQPDPLGNTDRDSTILNSASDYLKVGGTFIGAVLALSNWLGAADESTAPYTNTDDRPEDLDPALAYEDTAYLQNAYWISSSSTDTVKSMIMEHGSGGINMFFDENCYNSHTASYYSRLTSTNHGVTVIGWDDHYSALNFNEACRPSADGAWLAKNSWGDKWGDQGYFWISYEDSSVKQFIFLDMENADIYDHNYHYDGSLGYSPLTVYVDYGLAAVYQTAGMETGAETLEAVGVAITGNNVPYSLQIYKDIQDAQDPESGVPVFETPQTGTLPYTGYHTIKLDQKVPLTKGSTFSVVISLERGSNTGFGCWMDQAHKSGAVSYMPSQDPGQTYIYLQGKWLDTALETNPWTPRLKAFTSDTLPVPVSSVAISPAQIALGCGETARLKAELSPSDATDTKITWTSSDPSIASVTRTGSVTGLSVGTCTITAETSNGRQAVSNVTVVPTDLSSCTVSLNQTSYTYDGKKKKPEITVTNGSYELIKGTDYTTAYKDNVHAGTASVTITGKGNYTGSREESFQIGKADRTISGPSGITATNLGTARTFSLDAKCDGSKLIYKSNKKSVTVTSKGLLKIPKNFVGQVVVTIRAAASRDYKAASKIFTLTMNPPNVQISRLENKSRKKLVIKWNKNPIITGYELQYSTNRKFTKSTSTKRTFKKASAKSTTVSGLKKGKTYYVRIRTYKNISGGKLYSSWSQSQKIKITK